MKVFSVLVVGLMTIPSAHGQEPLSLPSQLSSILDNVNELDEDALAFERPADFPAAWQDVLSVIERVARYFTAADESDLQNISGMCEMTDIEGGNDAQYVSLNPPGVRTEVMYSKRDAQVRWVAIADSDGNEIHVCYEMRKQWPRRVSEAAVNAMGQHVEFSFHENGQMYSAVYLAGGSWSAPSTSGKFMAWDDRGNDVASGDVSDITSPDDFFKQVYAQLSNEQLDTLGVGAKSRLGLSTAFETVPPEARQVIEEIAGWSERFKLAKSNDLTKIVLGQQLTETERAGRIGYEIVSRDRTTWNFICDSSTDRILLAANERMAIYFDDAQGLIGGRGAYQNLSLARSGQLESVSQIWLISFHKEPVTPRIAMAATKDAQGSLIAQGPTLVWDTSGELILREDITQACAVSQVVRSMDSRLTSEQKGDLNWIGERETNYLLGDY